VKFNKKPFEQARLNYWSISKTKNRSSGETDISKKIKTKVLVYVVLMDKQL